MKKLIFIITASLAAFSLMACDAGKGVVAPVVVFSPPGIETAVPFDYSDCAAPATVTLTVSTKASVKGFFVRIRDLTTGVEYTPPTHAAYSSTQVFSNIPAAGHSLLVLLSNGSHGTKLNVTISVRQP